MRIFNKFTELVEGLQFRANFSRKKNVKGLAIIEFLADWYKTLSVALSLTAVADVTVSPSILVLF